jgi:predicted RNA-binding Zn ribbon-like protein
MASSTERPAPGNLAAVQAFINTADVMRHSDEIADPAALGAWFEKHGLSVGPETPTAADVRRAAELREALRRLILTNSGAPVDREAVEIANRAIRSAQLSFTFQCESEGRFEPAARGVDGALGRIVGYVAEAMSHGTWSRMKACLDEDCVWSYYDYSKNRSARWCNMGSCGNRNKARTFRSKHRTESAQPAP